MNIVFGLVKVMFGHLIWIPIRKPYSKDIAKSFYRVKAKRDEVRIKGLALILLIVKKFGKIMVVQILVVL